MKNILLLSSGKYKNLEYLEWCKGILSDFFTSTRQIALIPYARTAQDYDTFEFSMMEKLGSKIKSIHRNPAEILKESDGILVAGGNPFLLLYKLYEENLVELIKTKIEEKNTYYAGWGAGANIASPSLKTSYDMPIKYPKIDKALDIFKFQLITEYKHNDLEYDEKIKDYFLLNSQSPLYALPFGSAIKVHNNNALVMGNEGVFKLSALYEQYFKIGDFINF